MTSLPQAEALPGHGARVRSFDWRNLALRVASGVVLGGVAVAAVLAYGLPNPRWRAPFLILISVGGALLSVEWAAMATPRTQRRAATVTTAAVVLVILLTFLRLYTWAWVTIVIGSLFAALISKAQAERAADGGYGVLYIAPAFLALTWLIGTSQGPGWTLMLFAAAWGADVCAFLVGNLLKGPKLWPRFSPNKTWSGFFGGLAGGCLAAVAVAAALMHLSLAGAALIGFLGGLATMAGDLWESMLKRRFGVKDSGSLIPGHGGLLDRVDGMMFAVVVFAVARLVVKYGWAH